jgi:hypothetical protein
LPGIFLAKREGDYSGLHVPKMIGITHVPKISRICMFRISERVSERVPDCDDDWKNM